MPPLLSALDRSRAQAAARFIYARMMLARAQAIARGSVVALRFSGSPETSVIATYVDRNRNGVLGAEIAAGIDATLNPGMTLQSAFRGVQLEPVTPAGLVFSFTPIGTSSSGTFYLTGRDGSRFAVRVLGTTGRSRLLRYLPGLDEWAYLE